jgi:hypothetical protein
MAFGDTTIDLKTLAMTAFGDIAFAKKHYSLSTFGMM